MPKCKQCGYDDKAKNICKTKVDRIAKAIWKKSCSESMVCCGRTEAECRCWMAYRDYAQAAIKEMKRSHG